MNKIGDSFTARDGFWMLNPGPALSGNAIDSQIVFNIWVMEHLYFQGKHYGSPQE